MALKVNNGMGTKIIAIFSLVITVVGTAVGYGTLKGDVSQNTRELNRLQAEEQLAKSDPASTAAGQKLLGEIALLRFQLDQMGKSLDRCVVERDKQ